MLKKLPKATQPESSKTRIPPLVCLSQGPAVLKLCARHTVGPINVNYNSLPSIR